MLSSAKSYLKLYVVSMSVSLSIVNLLSFLVSFHKQLGIFRSCLFDICRGRGTLGAIKDLWANCVK